MCFAKKPSLNSISHGGMAIPFYLLMRNQIKLRATLQHDAILSEVIQTEISFKSDEDENWEPSLPQFPLVPPHFPTHFPFTQNTNTCFTAAQRTLNVRNLAFE